MIYMTQRARDIDEYHQEIKNERDVLYEQTKDLKSEIDRLKSNICHLQSKLQLEHENTRKRKRTKDSQSQQPTAASTDSK